ncbi:glucose-6-phosphate isomerase [Actinomycetota bacterium]|nr:glucose-6-phosphate isomerase [Actinomycetota bacterium]
MLANRVASRLGQKDATLYASIPDATEHISGFLGWTSLCSDPPLSIQEIAAIAAGIRLEGLEAVVLIGQGGSSQASMTITKLHEVYHSSGVAFRTMDSLSPVFVNHILGSSDPAKTLYIVSSKSGSTIEPLMLERVAWQYVTGHLGTQGASKRFVAITDPNSKLEQMAKEKGYRFVLSSPTDVGGRFSALSVFALFPSACIGLDIENAIKLAAKAEVVCTTDSTWNPALSLACFIYENYCNGRDKISLVMPPSGQVFGLWLEQLIAESLGKHGKGILPNVEVDASILSVPHDDRCVISYAVGQSEGFLESIAHFDPSIPSRHYSLDSVRELFSRFVIWEYAVAFLGLLLKVNPFDQPDVEDTKKRVKTLLLTSDMGQKGRGRWDRGDGAVCPTNPSGTNCPVPSVPPAPSLLSHDKHNLTDYVEVDFPIVDYVQTVRISKALSADLDLPVGDISLDQALRSLLGSLKHGDYFSLNAFLPFRGYGRREALERMRNRVASRLGVASCLEIGPRYLHSTGQLHKGGPDTGVFLFISADEDNDIAIPGENFSLGDLASTQARGDFEALASRGRRVIQVHLTGNDSETLSRFADRFCLAVSAVKAP